MESISHQHIGQEDNENDDLVSFTTCLAVIVFVVAPVVGFLAWMMQ